MTKSGVAGAAAAARAASAAVAADAEETETWTGREPDIVQRARRARVSVGEVALWNLGGAGFAVRSARSLLLIDPFAGPSNPPDWVRAVPPAFDVERLEGVDAVLMTHEHGDHADPVSLRVIGRQTDALAIGPGTCTDVARAAGVPEARIRTLEHGQSVAVGEFRITAVPAHDPGARGANGYVLELVGDGKFGRQGDGGEPARTRGTSTERATITLAHYGDSLYFPGIAQLRDRFRLDALLVAVGMNPPGRMYYMDEADAARAARDTGARILVPMHFNLWRATLLDPRRVAAAVKWYAPQAQVVPAHYGRRLTIAAA